MKNKIYTTNDGSHTIYVPELNEFYHSCKGALTESIHVFIENGFKPVSCKKEMVNILEVGLGTGLNCLLTIIESQKHKVKVCYHSLEPTPLDIKTIKKLNYHSLINFAEANELMDLIHKSKSGNLLNLKEKFYLLKQKQKIQDAALDDFTYDVVYYDAFGPKVQPDMWTLSIFEKIYSSMKIDGIFVTYCAKGQVRRDLKEVGFHIERLSGPPGKREMLRAIKK